MASRRSLPVLGRRARSGPTESSKKSRIAVESINDSPSARTKAGTRPSGLN